MLSFYVLSVTQEGETDEGLIMYMTPHPVLEHSMKQMKMGAKQAISRQDIQKQELTPNYLHLCIRKKGARMRGQHRKKQEQLRQIGKEKELSLGGW